jgi:hypothetical protein
VKGLRSLKFRISLQIWFIKIATFLSKFRFDIQRIFYKTRERISETLVDFEIFINLAKSVLFSAMFSAFSILIIFFLSPYTENVSKTNIDGYDNLLIAVASITGIFLSLYFTNINTVVGNLFAKSPQSVRNLFIQERINNISVRFLIWLTLVSLGALLLGVIWDIRPKVAILAIIFLGSFSILFFALLGKRAFSFFDPTGFSRQLLSELEHWSKEASSRGTLFTNPAFQDFYHRKAEIVVDGFVGLNKVALSDNNLRGNPLSNLIEIVITTYSRYLQVKRFIPTKSRWFTYVYKYKDWYLSSDFSVHIAAAAKAELFPSSVPDHYWLERDLENIEIEAIISSSHSEITNTTGNILAKIFSQFTELGRFGEIQQALLFHSKIENALKIHLEKKLPSTTEFQIEQEEVIQIIGVIEVLCSYLVTLVAGFFSSLDLLDPSIISKKLMGLKWDKVNNIYTLGIPFDILPAIEDIYDRLSFEFQVEGKIISPDWYLNELISRRISFYVIESISSTITQGIIFFKKWIDAFEKNNQVLKTIAVINQGLEFSEKLKTMVLSGDQLIQQCLKIKSIDLLWPIWKPEDKLTAIEKFNKELISSLASHLYDLSMLKRTDKIPDYFGKSIVLVENECFRSLDVNDALYFQQIFKHFFSGCLFNYENLQRTTQDWLIQRRFLALSEPLMDLFDMSGYALLYSEFHQNPQLWETCKLVWDNFINNEKWKNLLITIGALYSLRKGTISITEHDVMRSQWKIDFQQRLRSLPKKYINKGNILGGYEVPVHPSEIISVVAGHNDMMMLHFDPDEVFIDLYLNKQIVAKDIEFRLKDSISEMISRRRSRNSKMDKPQ